MKALVSSISYGEDEAISELFRFCVERFLTSLMTQWVTICL